MLGGFPPPAHAGGVVSAGTEQALTNALAGGGTVTFATNYSITLSRAFHVDTNNPEATIIDAQDKTITISGGNTARMFIVSGNLTLRGLTLTGGASENGGAVLILSNGVLRAEECTFRGNTAAGINGTGGAVGEDSERGRGADGDNGTSGRPGRGGAIYNSGSVALVNCTFVTNTASGGHGGNGGSGGGGGDTLGQGGDGGDGGAGAVATGGAVHNDSNLTVIDCTFRANTVSGGNGGAGGAAGTGAFAGLTGQGGQGGNGYGGAIYNALNLTMWGSAFSANTVTGGESTTAGTTSALDGEQGHDGGQAGGGALCNGWWAAITNCTFYTNIVSGGKAGDGGDVAGSVAISGDGGNGGDGIGGGVQSWATLTLVNCTLLNNGAYGGTNGVAGSGTFSGEDGRLGNAYGGNISAGSSSARATLQGTLIGRAVSGYPGSGTFIDEGFNMSPDDSLGFGSQSFPNTSPLKLGIFGDHGGPTPTVPLLAGSPALDKIPGSISPAYDQRGIPRPRPADKKSDIGAFERSTSNDWLPAITSQPTSQTVAFGGDAKFRVTASGDPPLHLQWRMNGTNILEGATTNILEGVTTNLMTLTDVQFTDEGAYDIVVTNAFGSVTSSVATLIVTMEVGGSVTEGTNGVPGVLVTITPAGSTGVVLTDADGAFSANFGQGTFKFEPSLSGYAFEPQSITVSIPPGSTNIDFAALPLIRIAAGTNGMILVTGGGLTNLSYTIDASTNLVDWEAATNVPGPIEFTFPIATNSTQFYRLPIQR